MGTDNKAECSSSFGHNNGFAASSYAGNSLDVVKVFLSLFPLVLTNVAPRKIIKYFFNLICINYIIYAKNYPPLF